MRKIRVSPHRFQQLATALVVVYALLVVTGGAVRLTGSGLGCPDWPACYDTRLIAETSYHPWVEFGNRLVTVAVSVLSVAVVAAAASLVPRRRDLLRFTLLILAGLGAQIVLGGLVVLFKLNPYLVALHFLLTFVVLAVAVALRHRAGHEPSSNEPTLDRPLRYLSYVVAGALGLVVTVGTVVTGSGPHAGAQGAKRVDIAFRDIAELHSTIALFLIGLTVALLFALWQVKAPALVQRRAQRLLELLALQGAIGYTQYFLHDNALLVEFHLAGATSIWLALLAYVLSLHRHAGRTAETASDEREPGPQIASGLKLVDPIESIVG